MKEGRTVRLLRVLPRSIAPWPYWLLSDEFSPDEVAAAEQSGVTVAGLGPRILRSESGALAAAAVVLSRSGDFA